MCVLIGTAMFGILKVFALDHVSEYLFFVAVSDLNLRILYTLGSLTPIFF